MRLAAAILLASLSSCAENAPSMLEPAGPGAERVEELWWPLLWISVAVFAVVLFLIALSLRRRGRLGEPLDRTEARWGEPFIVVAGVLVPWIILASVFVVSLRVMRALARAGEDSVLTIEVEANMWWWEVRYPNGAVTATEIHIPAGERVLVRTTTADVIHSFWVPQLQVKVDQIPGRETDLWLEADKPGVYRGQCAEYCGLQHAKMLFSVIAEPREEFEAWVAHMAQPAGEPATPSALLGREVFMSSSCFGCHAIRGTPASANLGPDLTHLALRRTIGSGILPNTRENLTRFILNPQSAKPGATMPPTSLSPDELEALLDYLTQLD
jgi:cytochrome c oxidase subunit 2